MVLIPSFKEYLAKLPTDVVFRHFLSPQVHSRKILSSSAIDEITRQMSSEKSIRARFSKLSAAGQHTISLVYLFGKRGLETQAMTGFDEELLGSFLVFAGKNETGKMFLFGFREFEALLAPLAAAVIIDKAKTPAPNETSAAEAMPSWLCLNDVTMLCICASAGILRLTRKGSFAKVSENAFKIFLHALREMAVPQRILFNYALEKGLMLLDKDVFRPQPRAILEWMEIPLVRRKEDFVEYASSNVPLWSIPVIGALFPERGHGRQWLSLVSPGETGRDDILSSLMCLHYIGILDVEKSNGPPAFTRTKPDNAERMRTAGRIMLLADFSAVLTREVLPEELYWFSKAGSIDSLDGVYKGTISRRIINDSLSEGTDGKKLIERLEIWDAPPNVLATVKEWIREFSRMYITSDATIVSTDERATNQIFSYQPLQRLIEPVRSDCVFRIRTGREQEVRNILVSMGFDPRMPGETAVRKRAEPGPAFNAMEDASFSEPKDMTSAVSGPSPAGGTIVPVVGFEPEQKKEFRPVKNGKYGQKLKELDMSDMFHVLDYAVLMGHTVAFEYRGSPLVKKGLYKVSPLHVQKSPEPVCEAVVLPKKAKKKFLLKCIIRIGVEPA
jgi:hypothetical protein